MATRSGASSGRTFSADDRLEAPLLLGEIGLFTPDGKRTATVRCKTDVQTAKIDYDQFKQLYFQNPQFGFRLLHLIVARMQHNRELAASAVMT